MQPAPAQVAVQFALPLQAWVQLPPSQAMVQLVALGSQYWLQVPPVQDRSQVDPEAHSCEQLPSLQVKLQSSPSAQANSVLSSRTAHWPSPR